MRRRIPPIHYDPFPQLRPFIATGPGHVPSGQPALQSDGGGVQGFIPPLVTDDPAWCNVTP